MTARHLASALVLVRLAGGTGSATPAHAQHPLDPLSADEIRVATRVMKADPRLAGAAFTLITVAEPEKSAVLAWKPGRPMARRARVMGMTGAGAVEVEVDLAARRLVSVTRRDGLQGALTLTEYMEGGKIALAHPEFQAGLRKRGVTDPAKLLCAPFAAGWFDLPEYEGRRLIKVLCFDLRRSTNNVFGWPIERLYALVDLRKREVLRVVDGGVVPINDGDHNFSGAATRPGRADTSRVRVTGHEVRWGDWRFHARVDGRVGTVISLARWNDAGRTRSVLYQGYLSEMFVPYMDAEYGWYSRTYFDTGEYGAGILATSLKPGIDCPATATFLPAVLSDDKGEPFTIENALCIFERRLGEPIWRHAEAMNGTYAGRPGDELVVRMAPTIGNYDYLYDWVFNRAAEIELRVGASGIVALKGVSTRHMSDSTAVEDTRTGRLVAPGLVAVNHDHYFNFRLDLDVDGPANSFSRELLERVTLPAASPRRSVYVVRPGIPATEQAALAEAGHAPAKLRVVNERETSALGNPVSYELVHANHGRLLLDPEDPPARRARFLERDVWVTPYEPGERYAAGDYVFGSRAAGGLPAWTERDRPIRDRDIVVWVNLGMHHVPRAEDMPVMPMVWHSFRLRPNDFFARNPAVD
jgi:primary-amine oxidase